MSSAVLRRPHLSPFGLNIITAVYMLALCNQGFWRSMNAALKAAPFDIVIFGLAVFMLTLFTLSLVSLPRLHRPALAVLLLVVSAASYYQSRFGILIDRDMIQNIMRTSVAESRQLITPDYLRHLGLTGILPAALVFWPKITYPPLRHLIWHWPVGMAVTLGLTLALTFADFRTISSTVREHREILGSYQPGASIGAVARYVKMLRKSRAIALKPLGQDAHKGSDILNAGKPVLLVVFAGETARAQNFGLNGYGRDTTPELAQRDVIAFTDATSCGTATAVSLPCMFSPFPQAGYSEEKFRSSENLMDVLTHAGIAAQWWDNNTGPQGITDRTGAARIDATIAPEACAGGECTDAALLPVLRQTLETMTGDTVLVLHMIGSHGPAYYLRYPEEARAFSPACESTDFTKCSNEEIVNAYDNTIRYSDHILAQSIDMMRDQDRVIPAMIFISDHGESLGENGLYLHAAPRFMAPDVQTRVPFVLWLSEAYGRAFHLDRACLDAQSTAPVSQDNLFHTVLGLMDVSTAARDPALDLTGQCRERGLAEVKAPN